MMSRDEVLGLPLRRPADINVVRIGSEADGTEGQGVRLEQRNEGEDSCRKRVVSAFITEDDTRYTDPHVPCRAGMVPGWCIWSHRSLAFNCNWQRDVSQVIQNKQPAVSSKSQQPWLFSGREKKVKPGKRTVGQRQLLTCTCNYDMNGAAESTAKR